MMHECVGRTEHLKNSNWSYSMCIVYTYPESKYTSEFKKNLRPEVFDGW